METLLSRWWFCVACALLMLAAAAFQRWLGE
jgi:hypothetical protein